MDTGCTRSFQSNLVSVDGSRESVLFMFVSLASSLLACHIIEAHNRGSIHVCSRHEWLCWNKWESGSARKTQAPSNLHFSPRTWNPVNRWVVQKKAIHPPSSKPALWSGPGLQLPFLCNYLDPVSQTQCGYQSTNSELRARRELHCRTALPSTICEREASFANEPVAQMICKVSFNSHSLPFLWNTPDLGGFCLLPLFPNTSLQNYTCTRPISWVIVPGYKLIPN